MKKYLGLGFMLLMSAVSAQALAAMQPILKLRNGSSAAGHTAAPAARTMPGAPVAGPAGASPAPRVGLSDATRMVQQSTGGRILEVHPQTVGGRIMYRFKVLTNSEVRIIMVDAETGAME